MNRKDVINVLKMENELIIFDPLTGEDVDVRCLNDVNKRCYIAHEEAIDFLRYSIPIEWIEKWFSQFYGEQGLEWNRCKRFMLEDWEKENE